MTYRVPPEGPLDARIAVVGESPGKNEWAKGRPFIGYSGDLLNDTLGACGLKRRDIYITNVIKDHLPPYGRGAKGKKEKARFFFDEVGHPTSVYLEGIMQVIRELQEVQANVVVPMGNYALWALMQHAGISKYRGSPLESPLIPGQKVIPTLHPAYFINSQFWHEFPFFEWDWQKITRHSHFPELGVPEYDFLIDPTPDEILQAVERFATCDLLASDTEWYAPNKLAYIGFADSADSAVCIPNTSMHAIRAYRAILGSDVEKVMQNAAFDVVALDRQGIVVEGPVHDTMVAWNACWASLRSKSLETQCSILTDQPYYKDELDFVGQDNERGQIYCNTDCVVTYRSWTQIKNEEFAITGGERGYEISQSAVPYFLEASKMGIRCDNEKRIQLKELYLEKADEIEDALSEALGYTINCRSSQQVTALVHDWLVPAYGLSKAKRNSRQENLMNIAAPCEDEGAQQILEAIIRVRQNRNIVSRYLHDGVVDIDGRMRTNWNPAGTRSGRYSSTIPWWPGLPFQTIPEDARGIFIADDGTVFIGFDYEQAEARYVAMLTYNHELLDDMAAGIDIHTKLATQLFNATYEELEEEIARLGKDGCRRRFLSKKSRHAFNYVEGANTFMLSVNREWLDTRVGLNPAQAQTLRANYIELNPGLKPWWAEAKDRMKRPGYIENAHGRRRMHTGPRITDDAVREMVSYEPQSAIADLCTLSITKICERLPYAQVMLHMHDGAMFQVPEDKADEAYDIMMEEAVWPMKVKGEELTIPAEGKIGRSWSDMEKKVA